MRTTAGILLLASALMFGAPAASAEEGGWISMFDGKTLEGWKANERSENWTVEDGCIVGRGERSHLFWMKRKCRDCEFKAEVKISDGGNSGMYFRAQFGPGWPKGYEAQVNSTHKDWKRTGSLYNFVNIKEQLVPPDTWFTQHIIVKGNHIVIKVNGKTVVDYVDEKNTYTEGYLALQQHDPGSTVWYRNLKMRPLD
ncbi:MAG TPA: DUF1080 domain-containing protein [Bryobacterales bacterium]|nr:DUF1080 domain-containing protein [Bryobacterales bacterium]